jgi:thermostable 8-oxoguanine DNA glycosylase
MEKIDFKKYVMLYSLEDHLFSVVGPQIKKRGYMTFDDFYKIAMWKSARQKPNYLQNKNNVESISKDAFLIHGESEKMDMLCSLKGVGIPTASAILTIVYPENYAVIDVRCIEMLQELGYSIKKTITPNNWLKYLDITRRIAKENNITAREVDKALFAMHREWLEGQNYRNLYANNKIKI